MQILGKVRRHHFTPEEKRSENLRGKKNSYLENILMVRNLGWEKEQQREVAFQADRSDCMILRAI